jgi:murein DD-endopeptidase MepM/ murein hydrolase activator NlpD
MTPGIHHKGTKSAKITKTLLVYLALLVPLWCLAAEWKLSTTPERVAQAGVVFVRLEGGGALRQPTCEWLGHSYALYPAPGGYRVALPVDRLQRTGLAALVTRAAGYQEPLAIRNLEIVPFDTGPIEIVRLTPSLMALNQDPRIEEETKRMRAIIQTRSSGQLWKGDFEAPTSAPGHDFGKRRRYVEVARKGRKAPPGWMSYHRGIDFALPSGTPVPAANAGRVIGAEKFVLTGNVVLIDHGQGIISAYMHLSEIKVKVGDTVTAGQIIGLSGSTGRSTGPHLHWSVYAQGAAINPLIVLHLPPAFQ